MLNEALPSALAHVRWLGGSVCSGKTTISDALAAQYGLRVYHCDRHERDHIARSQPDRHPTLAAPHSFTMDEYWLLPSPEQLAARSRAFNLERFELIVEDLLAMPQDRPILAEGFGLLPECVVPVLTAPRHALWLIAQPDFLAAMRDKRGMTAPSLTSDPPRARANIIARDVLMAARLRASVIHHGLTLVTVDGTAPIEATEAVVAQHFGLSEGSPLHT